MKITLDVPDTTIAMIVCGITFNIKSVGYNLAQKSIETSELEDGAEIYCAWGERAEDD